MSSDQHRLLPASVVVHLADPEREPLFKMLYERWRFFIYCSGIFVCYFYYGVLQEKITKGKYGEPGQEEKYTHILGLVFVQCIVNAIFAYGVERVVEPGTDTTTNKLYMLCSLSYVGAMLSSNAALEWVSYPTQVLGKSIKPIPVMLLGVLYGKKRYPLAKYGCVLLITLGVALFMLKDKKHPGAGLDTDHSIGIGEALLMVSLALDGLTGAAQDRMRHDHRTRSYHMMFNMNLWSVAWLAAALAVTGEGVEFAHFLYRYPSLVADVLLFSVTSALGQHFIFLMVAHYSPLACSIVTTTRKFFTILGSVLLFGHLMLPRQWAGTVMVFVGLALDSKYGKEVKSVRADSKVGDGPQSAASAGKSAAGGIKPVGKE